MSDSHKPWEPDPAKLGNWQAMFETRRAGSAPPPPASAAPTSPEAAFDDGELPSLDLNEYKPWILQRGRGNPALMLAIRRYDHRAALWECCSTAYHALFSVDYLGDKVVGLDFGVRRFMLEGTGLDLLARYLQQGSVLKIVEYAPAIWPTRGEGPIITAIRRIEKPA